MSKLVAKMSLLCLLTLPCFSLGCGTDAGVVGDTNDPAETSDEEMMQDETGEIVVGEEEE